MDSHVDTPSLPKTLDPAALVQTCEILADQQSEFAMIFERFGVPPMWDRVPGFPTLLHIILEQQVSLASAKACFDKLAAYVEQISPEHLLPLSDAELKAVGFSRQKASYARHLAEALLSKRLDLESLAFLPDVQAKAELIKLKGVGEWTSDIYLLMALLRPDIMPKGDIALHAAWHKLSGDRRPSSDEFVLMAEKWSPHRSVAARLLWHFYLSERSSRRVA